MCRPRTESSNNWQCIWLDSSSCPPIFVAVRHFTSDPQNSSSTNSHQMVLSDIWRPPPLFPSLWRFLFLTALRKKHYVIDSAVELKQEVKQYSFSPPSGGGEWGSRSTFLLFLYVLICNNGASNTLWCTSNDCKSTGRVIDNNQMTMCIIDSLYSWQTLTHARTYQGLGVGEGLYQEPI